MKKKTRQETVIKATFSIPQIPKIEGLRESTTYEKTPFVSPLFGTKVKDEVTPPFVVHALGDKVKSYDAFRTKPKMSEEEAKKANGSKYYEFTDLISEKTREEFLGVKYQAPVQNAEIKENVDDKNDVEEVVIKPLSKQEDEVSQSNVPVWMRTPKAAVLEPETDDFGIETYQREIPEFEEKLVAEEVAPKQNNVSPKPNRTLTVKNYILPHVKMFKKTQRDPEEKPQWLLDQIDVINRTLKDHAVEGMVHSSKKGPTVTRYEIALEPGVNVKKIISIQDNLMMALAATSLRIEAPIPGKPYVGIEVPNKVADVVSFGNVVDTKAFLEDHERPLKVALGEDIDGTNIYVDIAKMPHGLIAGGTGSGKSVSVNTILVSLLIKNKPEDLRLILVDPKMVELTPYNELPHLVTPVITDPKMASSALNWAVDEMERRYRLFAGSRSRDIKSFNDNIARGYIEEEKMPYIVIIIDELADLMMVAAHDVEDAIQRITQKARAAGIHLLVATQRPTTDVVKGTIKSNIPSRIAFKVSSFVDSTTILDGAGAETLLGRGDMLLKEGDRTIRLQGAYIPDSEIYDVVDFIKDQRGPNYIFKHEDLKRQVEFKEMEMDDLFEEVGYFVIREQNASINGIQKEFKIGFNRAQQIVTLLEQYEVVSSGQGTKAREVLVDFDGFNQIITEIKGVL